MRITFTDFLLNFETRQVLSLHRTNEKAPLNYYSLSQLRILGINIVILFKILFFVKEIIYKIFVG